MKRDFDVVAVLLPMWLGHRHRITMSRSCAPSFTLSCIIYLWAGHLLVATRPRPSFSSFDQVSCARLKCTETGLYTPSKKRGRPFGSPSAKRLNRMPSATALKKSPDEAAKRAGNLGKRKVSETRKRCHCMSS